MANPRLCHNRTARSFEATTKLNCIAVKPRLVERMRAHGSRDAVPERIRRNDIATIGHMRSTAAVVGAQIVGADDRARILSYKHDVARRVPIGKCVGPRNVTRNGIGLAGAESRFQNAPDGVVVAGLGVPDPHRVRPSASGRFDHDQVHLAVERPQLSRGNSHRASLFVERKEPRIEKPVEHVMTG